MLVYPYDTQLTISCQAFLGTQLDTDQKKSYDVTKSFIFGESMNIELILLCRNCGYKNRKSGSEVDDRISMSCKNCGAKIVLDAANLRTHLLNLERAVKEGHLFEFTVTIR
jgi:hypothetical protein